ncbi:hypothetical protein QJR26_18270 (plasmid) [Clostridium baratii]
MVISIKDFMEQFDFSENAINELKQRSFNKKTNRYKKCSITIYRGKVKYCGNWKIDFNEGICWL